MTTCLGNLLYLAKRTVKCRVSLIRYIVAQIYFITVHYLVLSFHRCWTALWYLGRKLWLWQWRYQHWVRTGQPWLLHHSQWSVDSTGLPVGRTRNLCLLLQGSDTDEWASRAALVWRQKNQCYWAVRKSDNTTDRWWGGAFNFRCDRRKLSIDPSSPWLWHLILAFNTPNCQDCSS